MHKNKPKQSKYLLAGKQFIPQGCAKAQYIANLSQLNKF